MAGAEKTAKGAAPPPNILKELIMHELTGHRVNPANDVIKIYAIDEPSHGGAYHEYRVSTEDRRVATILRFQNGPINEVGVNGITHEVLLAVLIDRLEGFQSGAYACDENRIALDHCREAQRVLHARTRARMERGVEGTHEV